MNEFEGLLQAVFFGAIVGGAWLGGRSKYRDKLISDLTAHNQHLQEKTRLLEAKVQLLENGFADEIVESVLKGLA